jgi:hypothetical protein
MKTKTQHPRSQHREGPSTLRSVCFWGLALEGAVLSLFFLIPVVSTLVTQPQVLLNQPPAILLALTGLFGMALASLLTTAETIWRRYFSRSPVILLVWTLIGGSFLLTITYQEPPSPWVVPDRLFVFVTFVTLTVYAAAAWRARGNGNDPPSNKQPS